MNGVMKLVDDDSPGYPIEETIVLVAQTDNNLRRRQPVSNYVGSDGSLSTDCTLAIPYIFRSGELFTNLALSDDEGFALVYLLGIPPSMIVDGLPVFQRGTPILFGVELTNAHDPFITNTFSFDSNDALIFGDDAFPTSNHRATFCIDTGVLKVIFVDDFNAELPTACTVVSVTSQPGQVDYTLRKAYTNMASSNRMPCVCSLDFDKYQFDHDFTKRYDFNKSFCPFDENSDWFFFRHQLVDRWLHSCHLHEHQLFSHCFLTRLFSDWASTLPNWEWNIRHRW
jgi:hypothetical protein